MLRILLADDHTLFRESITKILEDLQPKVIIYQASSVREANHLIGYYQEIDLIILDLSFLNELIWNSFSFKSSKVKNTPILILTASADVEDLNRSMRNGCKGYITKFSGIQQLLLGIKSILNGDTYISADMLEKLDNKDTMVIKKTAKQRSRFNQLSNRQIQILKLLAKGYSNKNIAAKCQISEGTVKLHVSTILKLLGVSNRTQAVIKVNKLNLL